MIDTFLLFPILAGLGVAMAAGPLGCFVVWRRMAFFGDTLAHSALLGISLGLVLGVNLSLGIATTAIAVALLVVVLQRQRWISGDTLLGILAHSSLAIGLVVLSFLPNVRIDLMSYLFGDVLAVTSSDLIWICTAAALALGTLVLVWRPLLSVTLHEELARAEGVPVAIAQVAFMVAIALVVAVAMKVVGILLITSLLIIPAAAARRFSRTPEQMAILAAAIGAIAVLAGLFGSLQWDTPAGPSIVVAAAVMFLLGQVFGALFLKQTV